MKQFVIFIFCAFPFFSFAQQGGKIGKKKLSKNSYVYFLKDPGGTSDIPKIYLLKPRKPFWTTISENEAGFLYIGSRHKNMNKIDSLFERKDSLVLRSNPSGTSAKYSDHVYFAEGAYPDSSFKWKSIRHKASIQKELNRIWYHERKAIFQPLTIPLKIRGSVDTVTYTAETGVNAAIGFGYKRIHVRYSANKSFIGKQANAYSYSSGGFIGLGATDIKAKVNAGASFKDRKEPIFMTGIFIMGGINSINIGFIVGKDYALRDGRKAGGWIYHGKTWIGFAVGIDLIK